MTLHELAPLHYSVNSSLRSASPPSVLLLLLLTSPRWQPSPMVFSHCHFKLEGAQGAYSRSGQRGRFSECVLLATSYNSPVLLLSPIGRSVVRFPVPSLQTAIDQDTELKIPPDGSAVGVHVCVCVWASRGCLCNVPGYERVIVDLRCKVLAGLKRTLCVPPKVWFEMSKHPQMHSLRCCLPPELCQVMIKAV